MRSRSSQGIHAKSAGKVGTAGSGPINDDSIVGSWRGLDDDSRAEESVFIHIQKPSAEKPLRVVFVEGKDLQIYEMHTTKVGSHNVFAAKATDEGDKAEDIGDGYLIGYYEIKGRDLFFYLLDADKVRGLIKAGKLKGNPGDGKFSLAQLTGSPTEVAAFLASQDGWLARVDEPARLRRLTDKK